MALPVPEWLDPLWKLGAAAFAGATTWRLYISKRSVNEAEIAAAVTLVRRHDDRIGMLENTGVRVDSRLGSIENQIGRLPAIEATTNKILGALGEMKGNGWRDRD